MLLYRVGDEKMICPACKKGSRIWNDQKERFECDYCGDWGYDY